MQRNTHRFLFLAAVLLMSGRAVAQRHGGAWDSTWQVQGYQPGMEYGHAIAAVPDLDGDGLVDIVASGPLFDSAPFVDNGVVEAVSGGTGTLLWFHTGLQDYEQRGWALAPAGDWNGDGVGDVISGSPFYDLAAVVNAGLVKILDGVTGVQIWTFTGAASGDRFGFAVAGGFDFDHDGYDDILIGAPGADFGGVDSGRVYLYSGVIGALVWTFDGLAPGDEAGASVAWLGDVDGDGIDDFAIGAPMASPGGVLEAGNCMIVSGGSGSLILDLPGNNAYGHLGHAVAAGRDLNGNGTPDVVVGAPGAAVAGVAYAGLVLAFEGASGMLMYELAGQATAERLGLTLAMTGDLDADGVADLAIGGRGPALEGLLQLHDGASGVRLFRSVGHVPGDRYASAVAYLGDLNSNGQPEMALGAEGTDPAGLVDAGWFQVLEYLPCLAASTDSISAAAGGAVDFALDFPVSEGGLAYVLLGSATGDGPLIRDGVAIPLTVDSLLLDFASGSPPAGFSGVYGTLDASGDGKAQLLVGAGTATSLVGRTWWFAAVSLSAPSTPQQASVAVTVTIVP